MNNLFDILDSNESYQEYDTTPLFSINTDDKHALLKWLNKNIDQLEKMNTQRNQMLRANLAMYKGIQYKMQDARSGEMRDNPIPLAKSPKLVSNQLYDFTETKIAQITQVKPEIEVIPPTDDYDDKISSKAATQLLHHLWYINDLDDIYRFFHKSKYIFGESYLFILWDKYKGDRLPDGTFNGDISYELEETQNIFLEKQSAFSKVNFLFRKKTMHMEEVKKLYPDKLGDIDIEARNDTVFDSDTFEDRKLMNEIIIYEFYHKKTKFLPNGYQCVFTKDVILDSNDLPYAHGNLPCFRLTDIDVPSKLHGASFYEILKPLQNTHNNLSSMIVKNLYMCSSPKWMLPRGSAKIESLGNDITVVQFQGAMAPQLVQSNPTPPEVYNFRDILKKEMEQLAAVHGIARNEPPPGITAAVALQFLDEQSQVRSSTEIAKHQKSIRDIAKMTLSVAAEYYDPNDGRMIRIVGKDNAYTLKYFENSNLNKDYDVRIQNGTALPTSKAARLQRIMDVMQTKPMLLTDERWIDLLEFGNDEKMTSLITEALRAAESENESMLAGETVGDPEVWEDLITHWRVHTMEIQKRSFKEDTPPAIRDTFIHHIKMTEFLIDQKMQQNPLFESQVAQLAQYPLFYKPQNMPRSAQDQMVQKQGDANLGVPSGASIPAETPASLPGEAFQSTNSPASANGTQKPRN